MYPGPGLALRRRTLELKMPFRRRKLQKRYTETLIASERRLGVAQIDPNLVSG